MPQPDATQPKVVRLSTSRRVRFRCPACGTAKRAPMSYAGRKVRCPSCQAAVRLPRPSQAD